MTAEIFSNSYYQAAKSGGDAGANGPLMSILSPIYHYDPSRLIGSLSAMIKAAPDLGTQIELIMVDDGTDDKEHLDRLKRLIADFPAAASLIVHAKNRGRAQSRNTLVDHAKGQYFLLLDCDMLPDCPSFLGAWLSLIKRTAPTIAYGGFTTIQASRARQYDLARAIAQRMDCRDARSRTLRGGVAVAASNLLVRADILKHIPFDAGFYGWGWEDTEWALRAGGKYAVVHVDIPATHLGLDTADVLLGKLAASARNFIEIVRRHPQMLATPGTQLARSLARLPRFVLMILAPISADIAKTSVFPLSFRAGAARVWRAIHAARALKAARGHVAGI